MKVQKKADLMESLEDSGLDYQEEVLRERDLQASR